MDETECSYNFEGESDAVKEEMKAKLSELIVSVFRKRSALNYYQVRDPWFWGETFAKLRK